MGLKKIELKDIIKETKSASPLDESFYLLTTTFPLKMIENESENSLALSLSKKLIEFLNVTKNPHSGVVEYLKTLTHLIREYENQKLKIKKINHKII